MEKIIEELFNVSKINFYETISDEKSHKIFEIINSIVCNSNREYKQILFEMFYCSPDFEKEIIDIVDFKDFSYIIALDKFLREIWWCLEDDGQLSFIKVDNTFCIKDKEIKRTNYMFTTRFVEDKKNILLDFKSKTSFYHDINKTEIKGDYVDYDMLINILQEITKESNWLPYTFNVDENEYLSEKFDYDKAFSKYIK